MDLSDLFISLVEGRAGSALAKVIVTAGVCIRSRAPSLSASVVTIWKAIVPIRSLIRAGGPIASASRVVGPALRYIRSSGYSIGIISDLRGWRWSTVCSSVCDIVAVARKPAHKIFVDYISVGR